MSAARYSVVITAQICDHFLFFADCSSYYAAQNKLHDTGKLQTIHYPPTKQEITGNYRDDSCQKSKISSKQVQEETVIELQKNLKPKCPLMNTYVTGSCDHNGGVISSKDGDLRLTIPKGAIEIGNLVTFFIATNLYGPFVLPSKCKADLASPYYWIGVNGSYHFQKPVKVEFEHFAVVTACDPSHYQLLTCEDDDESYTMQVVKYDLDFTMQGDLSLCTFETYKFCSYCLYHGCKDPVINRVAAIYLKEKDFKYSNDFTVQIWFSLPISYCIQRNKELYTKQNMVLDEICSCNFETSCDKSSTNFFTLTYDTEISGWYLSHARSTKIETKCINFYNYYTDTKELKANEDVSLFPPRFIVYVRKKHIYNTELDTNIMVTLCKAEEKPGDPIPFNLLVPKSATVKKTITAQRQSLPSFSEHQCDENKPELKELVNYSKHITYIWKTIALHLKISAHRIDIINIDFKDSVELKCYEMFKTWLQSDDSSCWCHFAQALRTAGSHKIADEVATRHLKQCSKSISAAVSPIVNVAENEANI